MQQERSHKGPRRPTTGVSPPGDRWEKLRVRAAGGEEGARTGRRAPLARQTPGRDPLWTHMCLKVSGTQCIAGAAYRPHARELCEENVQGDETFQGRHWQIPSTWLSISALTLPSCSPRRCPCPLSMGDVRCPVLRPALLINPELAPSERHRWQRNQGAAPLRFKKENPHVPSCQRRRYGYGIASPIAVESAGGDRYQNQGQMRRRGWGFEEAGVVTLGREWAGVRVPGRGSAEPG